MEAGSNEFCCGCLSGGRKMKSVNDFWSGQAFLQLLFEIQIFVTDDHTSWLCWECEARITNFAAFRNQAKNCSNTLLKYIQKDDQSTPKTVSRLNTYTLPVIDLNPDAPISYTGETYVLTLVNKDINKIDTKLHIKDEQDECNTNADKEQNNDELMIEKQIKNEVDAYSDDDRSLIDIRNVCKTMKDQLNVRKKVKNKNGKVKLKKRTKLYDEIELTPEEVVKERSIMKEREEYINSMFRCEKCIVPFPNTDDLNDHVRSKHELHGTKHMCGVCSRTFLSAGSLSAHVRCHTSRRRCVLCVHTTTSDRKAMAHYTEKHQDSEMYDLSTQVYQSLKSQDDTEMNGSKSTAQFPCEYCDKTFSWKTSLRKHMETHIIEAGHKRKPFCETCRLSFTTSANLRKHMTTSSKHQINSKLTKLKEDIPGSTSALIQREKDIESIASTINSQKEQFACSQCEKRFQWKGNLLRHLKSHAAKANGELVCEPCNRTFSSIATYKQHMQISRKHVSENEFKYVCSDCGKRFSNKSKLSDHINWDHLKKFTHRCSDCQKAFKSHTSLYLHRQVVHKHYNSEHLCDHCGKSFPNKTKLRSHIVALHTLETPYKCDACPARFGWHSCLSRHMRQVHKNMHRKSAVNS